jgi:hypothetical protein
MSAVKKVCINSSKNYYTGTELSPLHYGLSAEGYEINSIMEGYDKELWIVDIKNNKKVWAKNENLSRITHEEPVIKNILSLYCDTEEIEKINQLKQKCGKDGSYNLKDIKKYYNLCDDDFDNEEEDKCGNKAECSGIEREDNTCVIGTRTTTNEEKIGNISDKILATKGASNEAKCIAGDKNYDGDADVNATLKEAKSGNEEKCRKRTRGTIAKTKILKVLATDTTDTTDTTATTDTKEDAIGYDKKPTDYNIFVKFRLNELKEISTNKKDNFENVKIEWRELKKNKGELKIIMEKAYSWLNHGK